VHLTKATFFGIMVKSKDQRKIRERPKDLFKETR